MNPFAGLITPMVDRPCVARSCKTFPYENKLRNFSPSRKNRMWGAEMRSTQLASANPRKTGLRTTNAGPTQRWCSDCGKVSANVTGKSARTDGLHPSLALGLDCTEAATSRRRLTQCHPAVAMEQA